MSEHIQPLLDRIRSEGLEQAESERDALLQKAREEADRLLAGAKQEADTLRKTAEADAEASLQRGKASLEQAARDLLLQLRTEIHRELTVAAQAAAKAPLSSEELVADLIRERVRQQGTKGEVTVETDANLGDKLKALLPALLKDAGAAGGDIVLNPKTGAGFKLRFSDSAEGVDLSAEAVADALAAMVRPDLAALLRPVKTED